jgi:acetyl-CoA carboxylase carboxyl transferase subunit alpha
MHTYLEFEKPIAELEGRATELRRLAAEEEGGAVVHTGIHEEAARLEAKAQEQLRELYGKLTAWQKTLVARHPNRPHATDYIGRLMEDVVILSGDRRFGEDRALIAGLARFNGRPVAILGQEKGNDTHSRVKHNFGMARPEGYRKAIRVMEMADRFNLPVISFVDTSGAYPGIDAEERGQAEAIARSTEMCLKLGVPMVSVIIGEGGSGGAVAVATANRVLMLEHAVYSVISPEGCASILWHSADKAEDAAHALKLTAQDLDQLGVIDGIVPEPLGGAHREPAKAISETAKAIERALRDLGGLDPAALRADRRAKYLKIGREGL